MTVVRLGRRGRTLLRRGRRGDRRPEDTAWTNAWFTIAERQRPYSPPGGRTSRSSKSRPARRWTPRVAKKPGLTAFSLTSRSVTMRRSAWMVTGLFQLPPVRKGKRTTAEELTIGNARTSSSMRRTRRLESAGAYPFLCGARPNVTRRAVSKPGPLASRPDQRADEEGGTDDEDQGERHLQGDDPLAKADAAGLRAAALAQRA